MFYVLCKLAVIQQQNDIWKKNIYMKRNEINASAGYVDICAYTNKTHDPFWQPERMGHDGCVFQ